MISTATVPSRSAYYVGLANLGIGIKQGTPPACVPSLYARMPVQRNTFYYDAKALDEGGCFSSLLVYGDADFPSHSHSHARSDVVDIASVIN
jgi:hypothetical protein